MKFFLPSSGSMVQCRPANSPGAAERFVENRILRSLQGQSRAEGDIDLVIGID